MSAKILFRILFFGATLFGVSLSQGQILDGNTTFNTPNTVAGLTGYPVSVVQLGVPVAKITNIINGDTLVGSNLSSPTPISLGIPGLGTIMINWQYTAIKMADGSGIAIMLTVGVTPSVLGQAAPNSVSLIVLRPGDVAKAFLDHNAVMAMAVLNSPAWMQYRMQAGYGGGYYGGTLFGYFPGSYIYVWYQYTPYIESIRLGDTVYYGF